MRKSPTRRSTGASRGQKVGCHRLRRSIHRRRLLFESLESRRLLALTPEMIDVHTLPKSGNPDTFVQVEGRVYFTAVDLTHGKELWRTDGTEEGTQLVKDIFPGNSSSDPASLTEFNGNLFFTIVAGFNNRQLFKTDGTSRGTVPVAENLSVIEVLAVNDTLFMVADDGVNGRELWKTDGTGAGTMLVKDIDPAPGASGFTTSFFGPSANLTNVNGRLFFVADDGQNGYELWTSDGTENGTFLVKDINPAAANSLPRELVDVNGTLFFVAEDGSNGRELWKSNGTDAGTVLVKALNADAGEYPFDLTEVNGTLFFSANDGVTGRELWKSNGSAAGTVLVRDILPGSDGSYPGNLFDFNGSLGFGANDGDTGYELWTSDGSASGTVLVKDINPGFDDGFGYSYIGKLNGEVFFAADDGVTGFELWKSNGTENGTQRVSDLNPDGQFFPGPFANVSGSLIFNADNGTTGNELWKTDGSTGGTVLLKDISEGTYSFSPTYLTAYRGELFFSHATVASTFVRADAELWKTDGTREGTLIVKDLVPGENNYGQPQSSHPSSLTVVGDELFFSGESTEISRTLFKSDGTESGTTAVGGPSLGRTADITDVDGTALFIGADDAGFELWKSDGTPAGTERVKDIQPGSASSVASSLTASNGRLYFRANDGVHGNELWVSDGTENGTVLVKDIFPGQQHGLFTFADPFLTDVNGTLFFAADDNTNGIELWKSDGTEGGTVLVKDIREGPFDSNPRQLVNVDGILYFLANDGLWKSDGTANGTQEVIGGIAAATNLTRVGTDLYFTILDDLWKSDGTALGTAIVKEEINVGELVGMNGRLFFSGGNSVTGAELWTSDGSSAGTVLFADLAPGPASSNPSNFTQVDDRLYFVADDGVTGQEIWFVDVFNFDFGDAPDSYLTTLNAGMDGGARHFVTRDGPRLGEVAPDTEADSPADLHASADDDRQGNDEDGVLIGESFAISPSSTSTALVSVQNGGGAARLYGWIDLDGDGTFTGANEQIADGTGMFAGLSDDMLSIPITVPASTPLGSTFARFRVSTTENLGFDGPAPDGEVEDYRVFVLDGSSGVGHAQISNSPGGVSGGSSIDSDGGRIVFSSNADLTGRNPDQNSEIFLFDAARGDVVQITDTQTAGSFQPSISGSGSVIAFESSSSDHANTDNNDGNAEIFLFDLDSGELRQVTNSTDGNNTAATVNHDGSVLAFVTSSTSLAGIANSEGNQEIVRFESGGVLTQVTDTLSAESRAPRVNSTGDRIAYQSDEDGNVEIYLFDVSTGTTQVTTTTQASNLRPSISSLGNLIVFDSDSSQLPSATNADGNREVFLFDTEAGTFAQLTESVTVEHTAAQISHDGSRVTYLVDDRIEVLDRVTDSTIVIKDAGAAATFPSLDADGDRIAFISNTNTLPGAINPDGNNEVFLSVVPFDQDFGDAPQEQFVDGGLRRYPTRGLTAARHRVSAGGPSLGDAPPDADLGGQPTVPADGDDVDGQGDDEDGFTLVGDVSGEGRTVAGEGFTAVLRLNGSGFANAWIDWNLDGDWSDPGEHIVQNEVFHTPTPTDTAFNRTAPTGIATGTTFIRARVSSDPLFGPGGSARDGEVEDFAATIGGPAHIVTNINDSGPGSLRAAILAANATPNIDHQGDAAIDPDLILFRIPGPGPHTIGVLSALPAISEAVVIDGYSQAGAHANSLVEGQGLNTDLRIALNGGGGNYAGLQVSSGADGSIVRGLAIGHFGQSGVGDPVNAVEDSAIVVSANQVSIEGNFIGTTIGGERAAVNGNGIYVTGADNVVGGLAAAARNLISGNNTQGVFLRGDRNHVLGNLIGTDASGQFAIANLANGVLIFEGTDNNVGGVAEGAGNVLSNNRDNGVTIVVTNGNTVEGNLIGTDVTGTRRMQNSDFGVLIAAATNNTIGGPSPAARNVISGNTTGVFFDDGADNNAIVGNFIGTDISGTARIGNFQSGVRIGNADNNRIGGDTPEAGNVIAGAEGLTGTGVIVSGTSTGNLLRNNHVGTDLTDMIDLGFGSTGVALFSSNTTVQENTIAFNRNGVTVTGNSNTGNAILSNSIFENRNPPNAVTADLGIDLAPSVADGVTPNDLQPTPDADLGPNRLQNFPELNQLMFVRGDVDLEYAVPSDPLNAIYPITVEFFLADADGEEGKTLIGRDTYESTDGTKTIRLTPLAPISLGDLVVATATDSANNTSEFSAATEITSDGTAPVADAGGPYMFHEGGSVTLVASATHPTEDPLTLTYEWDLDGGGEFNDATGREVLFTRTSVNFDSIFAVRVRVTDSSGDPSVDTAQVTVKNSVPEANAGGPYTVDERSTITLIGSATHPREDSATLVFEWDLDGDGQFDDGSMASISFLAPPVAVDSAFPVRLRVTDADGDSDEASVQVNVTNTSPCTLTIDHVEDDGLDGSLREAVKCANATPGRQTVNVPAGVYRLTRPGAEEDAGLRGDLDLTDDLELVGAGAEQTVIEAGDSAANAIDRVLHVLDDDSGEPTNVELSGLTIRHGNAEDRGGGIAHDGLGTLTITDSLITENHSGRLGGGIQVDSDGTLNILDSTISNNVGVDEGGGVQDDGDGTMNFTRVTFSGNHSDREGGAIESESNGPITIIDSIFENNTAPENGGAIENDVDGDLTIIDSRFSGNAGGFGGAIHNNGIGQLSISNSTFSGNTASTGGAIQNDFRAAITVTGSTFAGNTAVGQGGGIWNSGGAVTITNSTFSNNVAQMPPGGQEPSQGGGFWQGELAEAEMTLVNVTLSGNAAGVGGGIFSAQGVIQLQNTILAGSEGGHCSGSTFVSLGNNLEDAADCSLDAAGDQSMTDPMLDSLADNGGATRTHALLEASPAIDAGSNDVLTPPLSLTTDQRGEGFPRRGGNAVDIGAFEVFVAQQHPWQNPVWNLDVTPDNQITPVGDVLPLINELNRRTVSTPDGKLPVPLVPPVGPPPFYDVNGDDLLTAQADILPVINFINGRRDGEQGEAEHTATFYVQATRVPPSREAAAIAVRHVDEVHTADYFRQRTASKEHSPRESPAYRSPLLESLEEILNDLLGESEFL